MILAVNDLFFHCKMLVLFASFQNKRQVFFSCVCHITVPPGVFTGEISLCPVRLLSALSHHQSPVQFQFPAWFLPVLRLVIHLCLCLVTLKFTWASAASLFPAGKQQHTFTSAYFGYPLRSMILRSIMNGCLKRLDITTRLTSEVCENFLSRKAALQWFGQSGR